MYLSIYLYIYNLLNWEFVSCIFNRGVPLLRDKNNFTLLMYKVQIHIQCINRHTAHLDIRFFMGRLIEIRGKMSEKAV